MQYTSYIMLTNVHQTYQKRKKSRHHIEYLPLRTQVNYDNYRPLHMGHIGQTIASNQISQLVDYYPKNEFVFNKLLSEYFHRLSWFVLQC